VYLTADLPGTGGVLRASPEDFRVEEIPAYLPAGKGDHVYVLIEKRDLGTPEAIRRIAQALGIRDGDIGSAGLKDRNAVTRQQLSLPPPVTPEQAMALALPNLAVLSAARHGNKLKTGHLRGNRFVLTIRGLRCPAPEAADRARAIMDRLASPPGSPNWYGEQRFGARGDNAARGRALVKGEKISPPPRDGREKRFLVSAYQSELFNSYLEQRMKDGVYARVITGDILKKIATGGVFPTTDVATDQARLDAGELAPTGPMFGSEMRAPEDGTDAAAREAAILAAEGVGPEDFARFSRIAEGTRRPLAIPVTGVDVRAVDDTLTLSFELPAGAYATVIAGEVIKPDQTS
jgi:tRNA pseudouridine13 synthase